jgi:hypothetical protein
MIWGSIIETPSTEQENEHNQKNDKSHLFYSCGSRLVPMRSDQTIRLDLIEADLIAPAIVELGRTAKVFREGESAARTAGRSFAGCLPGSTYASATARREPIVSAAS